MRDQRGRASFTMREHEHGDAAVVFLEGEVDTFAVDRLRRMLRGVIRRQPRVVVDLSDASFLDSQALTVIVGAARRAGDAGGELRVACPGRSIRKVFELTRMDRVVALHPSLGDAVASVSRR